MGGLVDSIFGGGGKKAAKDATKFQKGVFDWAKGAATPYINQGTSAMNTLGGLLGLGGTEFQDDAFQNYMNSTGYKFLLDSGSKAVTGSMAAKGLLKSGSTLKALTSYGQNLASTKTADYMNALMGLSNQGSNTIQGIMGGGNQAAANIGQLGQAGAQSQRDAFGSMINLGLGIAGLSDERLKTNIEKVGELASGIGLYIYNMISGGPLQWGFIAQEVAEKQPEALGPTIDGYLSVNYAQVK